MIKNKATFERVIDGRVVQCIFDHDLPSTIGKEFCSQFNAFIVNLEEAAAKAAEEQKKQEEKKSNEEECNTSFH